MGAVFEAACNDLHDTGQPALVSEIIANGIIEAAKKGERDPVRLRGDWTGRFGLRQGSETPCRLVAHVHRHSGAVRPRARPAVAAWMR